MGVAHSRAPARTLGPCELAAVGPEGLPRVERLRAAGDPPAGSAPMSAVCAAAGAALIVLVLAETFEAMVLPRRVTRPLRFARFYYRTAWALWRALADLAPPGRRRQTILSIFGPLSMLSLFAAWAAGLIVGFALLHRALSDARGLTNWLYFSGVTFTTLGYGDVTPDGRVGKLLAVAEGLVGFGFLAVV